MWKPVNPPYEGNEPFVFVSYCRKDAERVYPLIALLEENDFRVWYDQGIDPGSEWPEVIANHLDQCSVFLAFISQASQESHNCRKEFNFAVQENKPSVCVILEKVALTPVMKMQMASIQAIDYEQCASKWELLDRLMKMEAFRPCQDDGATVLIPKTIKEYYLNRKLTGEKVQIRHSEFKVGRNMACDYRIEDNRTVSKIHAIFDLPSSSDGSCTVLDNHSTNKVYVNDELVKEGEKYPLQNGDLIEIGSEKFILEIVEVGG